MREYKTIATLVIGILVGITAATARRPVGASEPFRDAAVHRRLLDQILSSPDIVKVESLQMGFGGKSLLARVAVRGREGSSRIDYILTEGGYYQAQGQWKFDVGKLQLWPYRID